jgi:glucose-1-phosphate adenylyltransferase
MLTEHLAKPAVPFGGKYRIIDFTLSNCAHSDFDTVGVLTQYQPLVLNSYIGIGSAWGLDRSDGGVTVLPPFIGKKVGSWYSGTANAIYQNIGFLEQYDPQYVCILSGDHIYKMNYAKMLKYHKEKKAEATIAVIAVPWEEAGRFGIMETDAQNRIVEFSEKPEIPLSNLASMGIYIFNWKTLKKYLIKDAENPASCNDFGKDIIPLMLREGRKLYAYPFAGYWKDVGTLESLWQANMDLLDDHPLLDLHDPDWPIYSVRSNRLPQYLSPTARVHRSLINEGCLIYGHVEHSVISYGVYIGNGSYVKDSVVMPNVRIGDNVRIERAIIGENAILEDGVQVGSADPNDEITLIGPSQVVRSETLYNDKVVQSN